MNKVLPGNLVMPNSYFQFKQFRVEQGQCAMKVSSLACVFGALIKPSITIAQALDIGTGTGLLALMLAQRTTVKIDAVEIDEQAFHQAKTNFAHSPWHQRLQPFHTSVQAFEAPPCYDLIMANPPFYPGHQYQIANKEKHIARHTQQLTYGELAQNARRLLAIDGEFWVLLPCDFMMDFIEKAKFHHLHLRKQIWVAGKAGKPAEFAISVFSPATGVTLPTESHISIHKAGGGISSNVEALLRPYYLYL